MGIGRRTTMLLTQAEAYTDHDVLSRFWAKVNKRDDKECWLWLASTRAKGYGAFGYTVAGKLIQDRAHRFSWGIHNGLIPMGMCVLHKCDIPACVNPPHLFLGTIADNNADMVVKGRHVCGASHKPASACDYVRGMQHHNAKVTPEIVLAIREDHCAGLSFSKLAAVYGISIKQAHYIVRRKAWKHVT